MSLNWDISKCNKDINNEATWPITNAIIWLCMSIDMPGITWENIKEFQKRAYIYQIVKGGIMSLNGEPYMIDNQHIKDRVGLSTNVGYKSEAKFAKKIWTILNRDAVEHLERSL